MYRLGLAATSATDVWAVGSWQFGGRIQHTTGPQRFQDVPLTQPFYPFIQWMVCRGYISGYTCGGLGEPCVSPDNLPYFRPGNSVARGQLMKMVILATGWPLVNPPEANRTFEDVLSGNPFYTFIETGASHGVISGYTCGGPRRAVRAAHEPRLLPLGRRHHARPVVEGDRPGAGLSLPNPPSPSFADVPPSDPFYGFVEAVYANNIVSGYTCGGVGEPCDPQNRPYFRPAANATRGQVTKFVTLAYGEHDDER